MSLMFRYSYIETKYLRFSLAGLFAAIRLQLLLAFFVLCDKMEKNERLEIDYFLISFYILS